MQTRQGKHWTQCLWSAGPGWGICIAYGVYAKKKDDVVLATTVQGFGDMSVAMLAAVAILPGLFSVLGEQGALDACASGNNGLAFIALTGVFETMAGGRIFACLFWIALICASITSIIAMYSIVVQPLADAGISKKKAPCRLSDVRFRTRRPYPRRSSFRAPVCC